MASIILISVLAIVGYWIYSYVTGLVRNIAAAKRTGLPYVVSPINPHATVWLAGAKLLLPVVKLLPNLWTSGWLPLITPDWIWTLLYEPFEKFGDTWLQVSCGGIILCTTSPEAIHQITSRREAFPKPLQSYEILEIFGRSIISTEGAQWKQHRKISSPAFNEKNNALVFAEAIAQTQGMIRHWTTGDNAGMTIETVPADALRTTLHIISRIGFGVRLLWPGEELQEKDLSNGAVYGGNDPPEGHSMTFANSLETLLEYILLVLLVPKGILKRLPFHSTKEAYKSYIEWKQYMDELFAMKVQEAKRGDLVEGMDLLGNMVRSSYSDSSPSPSRAEKGQVGNAVLSDSDILGNAFIMIVAGHETTANSIHFGLMELAINPRPQKLLQKEIQTIFGDKPPETWDYESSINTLLGGICGAIMNEQLRLMPPVIAIPKHVTKTSDQEIVLDGKKVPLPAATHITINAVGVHRNPNYWPSQPSKVSNLPNDLNDFIPERWIVKAGGDKQADAALEQENDEGFGGYTGQDSSAQLFRPVKGSYIPFSEGPRSCLGRRLAQVELMAVFAVIFQKYSLELAVDQWATDEEVTKMSDPEKRDLYKKAQIAARATIRSCSTLLTLKLHPGFIPIRVVKKGEERFIGLVE